MRSATVERGTTSSYPCSTCPPGTSHSPIQPTTLRRPARYERGDDVGFRSGEYRSHLSRTRRARNNGYSGTRTSGLCPSSQPRERIAIYDHAAAAPLSRRSFRVVTAGLHLSRSRRSDTQSSLINALSGVLFGADLIERLAGRYTNPKTAQQYKAELNGLGAGGGSVRESPKSNLCR